MIQQLIFQGEVHFVYIDMDVLTSLNTPNNN